MTKPHPEATQIRVVLVEVTAFLLLQMKRPAERGAGDPPVAVLRGVRLRDDVVNPAQEGIDPARERELERGALAEIDALFEPREAQSDLPKRVGWRVGAVGRGRLLHIVRERVVMIDERSHVPHELRRQRCEDVRVGRRDLEQIALADGGELVVGDDGVPDRAREEHSHGAILRGWEHERDWAQEPLRSFPRQWC